MSIKVTIEFDPRFENGMRRALAMFEEMEQLGANRPRWPSVGPVRGGGH